MHFETESIQQRTCEKKSALNCGDSNQKQTEIDTNHQQRSSTVDVAVVVLAEGCHLIGMQMRVKTGEIELSYIATDLNIYQML